MKDEKFLVTQPRQMKNGAWLCTIFKEDKETIVYEVIDMFPRWAFASCAFWIMDYNEQMKLAEASEVKKEDNTDGQVQQT
jgi:bacteriorhodopsin